MAWRRKPQISPKRLFSLLMMISLAAFLLPRHFTDPADHLLAMLTSPFTSPARQMSLAVVDKTGQSENPSVDAEKYQLLQQQLLYSRNQIANLTRQHDQLQALFDALTGLRQQFGLAQANFIVADAVAGDSTGWRRMIVLNRGSADSIQPGQIALAPGPAVDPEKNGDAVLQWAVVGRISKTGAKSSDLQLISDPGFSLPVHVMARPDRPRWLAEGILQAQGMGKIKVSMIAVRDHPLQPGDVIFAAARSDYLPIDMIVGIVVACKKDDKNPLFWDITAEPAVDLNTLSRIILIDTRLDK